jgi:two-component system chemotaxis response regulator CheY
MRALLVDDSRAIRMILARTLEELGYETTHAADGAEAWRLLQATGPYDLALVDWNMPQMNGFDLLTHVRAERAYDGMRVVMVTTETEMEQIAKALEAGANEYIMKPFTPEVLREKLRIVEPTEI